MNDDQIHGFSDKLDRVLKDEPRDEARRLLQMWHLLDDETEPGLSDERVAEARRAVLATLDEDPSRKDRAPRSRLRRGSRMAWPVAAVLAAAFLFWWMQPTSSYAPHGDLVTVELSDGTRVQLNSGSGIRYDGGMAPIRSTRVVELQGEAFFDVPSSDKPFIVRTFNADVTVLGTRFNVRAWADIEASTFVTVEEGDVVVQRRSRPESVQVATGESVRIGSSSGAADSVSVRDALAWRSGDLIFKDRMLGAVVDDIHRRFGVTVRIHPSLSDTTRVHLARRNPGDAETVVSDLARGLRLQYRERADGYEIYRP